MPKAFVTGRGRWLTAAAAVAASLPVIVALITAISDSWAPGGDRAVVATRAYDVLSSHSPLVGAFSTSSELIGENTYSPGPLLYWLLALPSHLPGLLALPLIMALVNGGSAVASVLIARKRAGPGFALIAGMAIAVMCSSLPADLAVDIWAPSAPVLPFTLLIFVGWSVACGELRMLPVAVVLASFVTQCHLAYLVPSALILLLSCAALVLGRSGLSDGASVRRWALIALLLGLLCWSFPILDQALAWAGRDGHGNFAHIVDAAGSRGETAGVRAGVHAVARTIGIPAWWLRGLRDPEVRTFDIFTPLSALTIASTVIVLLGLVAALVGGRRRKRPDIVAAAALALVLCVAVAAFTTTFPNQGGMIFSYSYSSWWTAPVGMWAWLVLGWAASVLVPFRPRLVSFANPAVATLAVAAVVGVGLWAGLRSRDNSVDPRAFAPTREVISQVNRDVPERGPVLMTGRSFGLDASVVFALRRNGLGVGSPLANELGRSYGVDDRRFDQVLNIRDGVTLSPGARLIARVTVESSPPKSVTIGLLPAP